MSLVVWSSPSLFLFKHPTQLLFYLSKNLPPASLSLNMSGFSSRRLTFTLLVAIIVWSSSIETCNARRSDNHWRQKSSFSTSLTKKKDKGHGSKPKPSQKTLPPPPPQPKENITDTFDVLDFGAKGDGTTDDTKVYKFLFMFTKLILIYAHACFLNNYSQHLILLIYGF